jgi:phosphoribosylformimino-5-aminoimidazole carboxamide ribotide isomerase
MIARYPDAGRREPASTSPGEIARSRDLRDPPSASFDVIPAIDLMDGGVVRLPGGDLSAPRRYPVDPVEAARGFVAAGAGWIHVVDLDGARRGAPSQSSLVAAIVDAVSPRAMVQAGGGIRSLDHVGRLLAVGVGRVILGTAAVAAPELVRRIVAFAGPARVAVALDLRGEALLGSAWRAAVGDSLEGTVARLIEEGVRIFVATAVGRDGLLGGPDPTLVVRVLAAAGEEPGVRVYAAGGVRSEEDLILLRDRGAAGAIVGRALYEGRLDLARAIRHLGGWRKTANEPTAEGAGARDNGSVGGSEG